MKKWLFFAFLFTSVTVYAAQQLKAPATRDIHRIEALKEEIRHQLLSKPCNDHTLLSSMRPGSPTAKVRRSLSSVTERSGVEAFAVWGQVVE